MSEPKFTPGTWKRHGLEIYALNARGAWTIVDAVDSNLAADEVDANLILIAASKDLYAACKVALNRLIDLGAEDDKDLLGPCEATELVRSAIAKVEGQP